MLRRWVIFIGVTCTWAMAAIPASERQALIDLYEATQGDDWYSNSGWKEEAGAFSQPGTEGRWYGVVLDAGQQHVRRIKLYYNNLRGSVPESLSDLLHLESFEVCGNRLEGSVPDAVTQLSSLTYLEICQNEFTSLPDLSPLSELAKLEAGGNQFSGTVPLWILNFPELDYLNLEGNQYSGDFPSAFAGMERPVTLVLGGNQINRFPQAVWKSRLTIDLNDNLLDEASCEAVLAARAQGVDLDVSIQNGYPFPCAELKLVQVLPWVSEIEGEWSSQVTIYNPNNEPASVRVKQTNRPQDLQFTIPGKSNAEPRLFGADSGFGILIYSDTPNLTTTYRVSGLRSPSKDSPALTTGQSPDEGSGHLFFPVLPESLKTAVTLLAPEADSPVQVQMVLYGSTGRLAEGDLTLQAGQPRAFLLADVFEADLVDADVALEVISDGAVTMYGTAFAFNDLNEPAMMPALPWVKPADDLVMPWVASNEQWSSQIALFNPNSGEVRVSMEARTPDGEVRNESVSLGAGRLLTFESGSLFPDLRGYAMRIKAAHAQGGGPAGIFANQQVANLEARTISPSSALTPALPAGLMSPVAVMPIPNLMKNPIAVLHAPENQGVLKAEILFMVDNNLAEIKTIELQDANPKPLLLSELTPTFFRGSGTLVAMATSGAPLSVSFFDFNEFREPSLTTADNQNWSDLGISVAFIPDCEGGSTTRISISNAGPLASVPGVLLRVGAGGQTLASSVLNDALGAGESAAFEFEDLAFDQPLDVQLILPKGMVDGDISDNHRLIASERSLALRPGYRLRDTDSKRLTGVIGADESSLVLPLATSVIACGDMVDFEVERLQVETEGEKHGPDYKFHSQWQASTDASVTWLADSGEMMVTGLETGAVYRIHGIIRDDQGGVYRFPELVHLTRSNYEEAGMVWPSPEGAAVVSRVFHPFDSRSWLPDAILGRKAATVTADDEAPTLTVLSRLLQAAHFQFRRDASDRVVLEFPEGIFELGFSVYHFRAPLEEADVPHELVFHGAGPEKTFFVDSRLAPAPTRAEHFFGFEPRLKFSGFDAVEIRDVAIWGAIPGGTVMEVSGRPIPVFPGEDVEPYGWFSSGIKIETCREIEISDVDLRFHRVGLFLASNVLDGASPDMTTQIHNFSMAYGDSGILMQDHYRTRVGGADIFHVSREGIFGNRVRDLIIEDVTIDGARQRGINLDQSQRIWIRNNHILNSGQTGIHFGGDIHFAAVTGNTIETIDRDRPNPFHDENSNGNGETLFYRPLYEAIKSVHGRWGDSDHLYIADNTIRDVADGVGVMQGNASQVLIEGNDIEAWRRGIRLGFGYARTLVTQGETFQGFLSDLFVMADNQIEMTSPVSVDSPAGHGVLFPGNDPNCFGCNIGFLDSYGADFGKRIAFYPFPIQFSDACQDDPDPACTVWYGNADVMNEGLVYLPELADGDYQHPNAASQPLNEAAMTLAAQLRQAILAALP